MGKVESDLRIVLKFVVALRILDLNPHDRGYLPAVVHPQHQSITRKEIFRADLKAKGIEKLRVLVNRLRPIFEAHITVVSIYSIDPVYHIPRGAFGMSVRRPRRIDMHCDHRLSELVVAHAKRNTGARFNIGLVDLCRIGSQKDRCIKSDQ